MNARLSSTIVLALLCACSGSSAVPKQTATAQDPARAKAAARLLFDDEFSGTALGSEWSTCYPYANASQGCSNNPGLELEWYRPANAIVGGGAARLVARAQSVEPNYPYTSGMISTGGTPSTKPTFSFLYGYAEARIEVPRGAGMWPAFWLVPANGTWPPEIDIMEWQGVTPKNDLVTIHWGSSKHPKQSGSAVDTGVDLYGGFHTYAVDWEPSIVTWYFDGKPIKAYADRATIPHLPMYAIVNLAIGGWLPGQLHPSPKSFPATLSIDYVRVWNHKPA